MDIKDITSIFDKDEVSDLADSLGMKDGESFVCLGVEYKLWLCPADPGSKPECFWTMSTEIPEGIDIYITKDLPDDFKRAVLVHKIVESAAYPKIGDMFKSHLLAREYDTHYAESHFSLDRLEEFLRLDSGLV